MRIWLLGTEGRMAAMAKHMSDFRHQVFFSGLGCPGTGRFGARLPADLKNMDFDEMANQVRHNGIELVVPGSEDLYAAGVVNELNKRGCLVFGPTRMAARIETSKLYSDTLMSRAEVPHAFTLWYQDYNTALRAVRQHFEVPDQPLVIKPDGRTGGKGVVVAHDLATAETALSDLMLEQRYDGAGTLTGLAEYLEGPECSVFVLCDGDEDHARFLAVARDCKPLYPATSGKPAGPNTGGMWSTTWVPEWTDQLQQQVMSTCVFPVLLQMRLEGEPFRGLLYVSLKLTKTGPKVVEYNGRFGDPEAQAVLQRLQSDLVPILLATTQEGLLFNIRIGMSDHVGGCLVIAANGYPQSPQKGKRIRGIEAAEAMGVSVQHCGTKLNEFGELIVDGGRVLNLNASAPTLEELRTKVNAAAALIEIEGGCQFRTDLGDPSAAS